MSLKQIIRDIVLETIGPNLHDAVRQILIEELTGRSSEKATSNPERGAHASTSRDPRPVTRRKSQGTQVQTEPRAPRVPVPRAATAAGVAVGQKWQGKQYAKVRGRTIEIVSLDKESVTPKVLNNGGKRIATKKISYEMLTKNYNLVSST